MILNTFLVSGTTSCQCSGCGLAASVFTNRPLGALRLVSKNRVDPSLSMKWVSALKSLVMVTKGALGFLRSFKKSLLPEVFTAAEMIR